MGYGFIGLTPEIESLANKSIEGYRIDPELYAQYDVKRGLRDINGNGVVAGLTNISTINVDENGFGKLYYRGIDVEDIVNGFIREKRFGFEETIYLLLFGKMPTAAELDGFRKILVEARNLPSTFTRDIIMKSPSDNMMNILAKSVLCGQIQKRSYFISRNYIGRGSYGGSYPLCHGFNNRRRHQKRRR